MDATSILVVVRPKAVLYHAGTTYGEGDTLSMNECEARALEEHGVISRAELVQDVREQGVDVARGIALGLCAALAIYLAVALVLAFG